MDAIYTDPDCSKVGAWASWRDSLAGAAVLGPAAADVVGPIVDQARASELKSDSLGLSAAEGGDHCFLGAATLLLSQVVRSWRGGRFFAALQAFTLVHDSFLTNVHPGFYEHSLWPIGDTPVEEWKDRLLYQIRRFRQHVGRRSHLGPAGFGEDAMPDAVERENLGSLASHIFRQDARREVRRRWANSSTVQTELIPWWETTPQVALVAPEGTRPRGLKVYVYTAEDVPGLDLLIRAPAFCQYRQWGMDVGFHDFFRASPLRTYDPGEADYFFVPSYACCHQVAGIADFDELEATHAKVVERLPFFQRSGGRDHIFSFHYVDLFPSWRSHIPRSVFLTPETEVGFERSLEDFSVDQSRFPPFNPLKDLSIPPFINLRDILGFVRSAKPVHERQNLAAFAGKLWQDVAEAADVRQRVAALGAMPGVDIHAFATITNMLGPPQLHAMMGNALFCLVPRGRAAWSVRFFEALWAGCVPVLLSDHYQPPFEDLFDVSSFVIKWPVNRIDNSLIDFLRSLPLHVVSEYVLAAKRVRCWYLYPPPEVAWLGSWVAWRELEQVEDEVCPNLSSSRNAYQAVAEVLSRRARASKASPSAFYMPDPHRGYEPTLVGADLQPLP